MNTLLQQLPAWIADAMLFATGVLALGLLATAAVWRISASARHMVVALSLACLPLLAAGVAWMPRWSLSLPTPPEVSEWRTGVSFGAGETVTAPAAAPVVQSTHWSALDVGWATWAVGFGAGVLSLLVSGVRLRALRSGSTPLEVLGDEFEGIDIRRSEQSLMPMTWGILRPVIMLPKESAGWDNARLQLVLQHEVAHIQRRDALSHLWCSVVAWMFWFHPLAWVALKRMEHLRELACDDAAVRRTDNPTRYAEELLAAVSALQSTHRMGLGLAIGISRQGLRMKARLQHILDSRAPRKPLRPSAMWSTAAIMAAAVGLMSGFCVCREVPQVAVNGSKLTDGSQVYFLTDAKYKVLSRGNGETVATSDPFSGKPPAPSEALVDVAVRIRSHLLDEGIVFQANDKGEALVMTDARAMRVWADEENHKKLATLLGQGGLLRLILIRSHVFEVPLTHENIKLLTGEGDPKRFDIRGVLTAAQGAELLEKLKVMKDVSFCAAPSITAASGQKATVEVVREFYYPSEFDPPYVDAGKLVPASPTAFEMRPVGLRMDFDPTLGRDGKIELTMAPELTEFEGYVNYGGPDNRVTQPVFSTMKASTSVSMDSGAFVVLGGAGLPRDGKPMHQPGALDGKAVKDIDPAKLPDWKAAKKAVFFVIQATVAN